MAQETQLGMQTRSLLNLGLLVLVTGLTVYLLSTEPPQTGPAFIPISTLDPDSVNTIQLSSPGKPDLELQKSGTGWQITNPISLTANPFRVNSLLTFLQSRSISTVPPGGPSFGLAEADNPVTLVFNDQAFRFGDINPLDRSRYIQHNNTVHLVEDNLYPQLLQDAAFFASNRLLAVPANLLKIRLGQLELEYLNNAWQQTGGTDKLTEDRISTIAAYWQGLEASRVSAATTMPSVTDIALETTSGNRIDLATIALEPELLLQRLDTHIIYHYPASTATDLGIALNGN